VLDLRAQTTWRIFDPATGALKRVLLARRNATPADVERGLLVYVIHRQVHVLRLADGHERVFIARAVKMRYTGLLPVLAQIEPSGLYYPYEVRESGRVRFVPVAEIRFR
jgi:hypothetical protein